MSNSEVGLDCFIEHDDQVNSITIQEDITKQNIKIQLEKQPLIRKQKDRLSGNILLITRKMGRKSLKLSRPSDFQPVEATILRKAQKYGVEGVATLLG